MKESEEQRRKPKVVSISEAARMHGVSRQALHVAIGIKRLKATKDPKSGRFKIAVADLEEYRRTKYSRKFFKRDGKLVFDKEKGLYSVAQAAEIIGVKSWDIYYSIRKGELKSSRNGAAYVLHIDDIKAYQKKGS